MVIKTPKELCKDTIYLNRFLFESCVSTELYIVNQRHVNMESVRSLLIVNIEKCGNVQNLTMRDFFQIQKLQCRY